MKTTYRNILFLIFTLLLSNILLGCSSGGGGSSTAHGGINPSSEKQITKYSLNGQDGVIVGHNISVIMPYGSNLTKLVATYTTTGAKVSVMNGQSGTREQIDGKTANDFTNPVKYVVTAADGSTATYTVTVTVAKSSDKAIKEYSLTDNYGNQITGTITGQSIAVTMPYKTNVESLVATFVTTGDDQNVTVNGVTQKSGETANNFQSPVTYIVTAADGSTVDYTVYVTVAKSSDKAITDYALIDHNGNLAKGTINGQNIYVSLPYQKVESVTAIFHTNGVSVKVNNIPQKSNVSTNNFESPVTYVVTAADSTTANYTVNVAVAKNSANEITSFALVDQNGVRESGVINGTNITVNLEYNANIQSLTAEFVTTGESVAVNNILQHSGETVNSFKRPLDYVVTAANGDTKHYTVSVDYKHHFAYVLYPSLNKLYMNNYIQSTGVFESLPTPSIDVESNSSMAAIDPIGRYVFVAESNGLVTYAINKDTGELTKQGIQPFRDTGRNVVKVVVNPSGTNLYLIRTTVNMNAPILYTYKISSDGNLQYVSQVEPTPNTKDSQMSDMVIAPNGKYAYVTTYNYNSVLIYSINPDGSLQALTPTTPIYNAECAYAIVIAPSGKYVYVENQNTHSISMYKVNPDNGELVNMGVFDENIKDFPKTLAIMLDPLGKYLYRIGAKSNLIIYGIDQETGKLTKAVSGQAYFYGLPSTAMATSPLGDYLYVASSSETKDPSGAKTNLIGKFKIDLNTGITRYDSEVDYPGINNISTPTIMIR